LKVKDLRISLITVVYNAEDTISRCIESVIAQNYPSLEYIVIDGGSSDHTVQIINNYKKYINVFISEPDKGVYDAMNKGINCASGDIVGMLNADDFFAEPGILKLVAAAFAETNADILYGNLDLINPKGKIIRKWSSGLYTKGMFNFGWMPPHPTFYCKTGLFKKLGFYSLDYGTAADYELMLRFIHNHNLIIYYLNKVMVKMQCGGMSNKFPENRVRAWRNDLKAMRNNNISFPIIALIIKPLRKISQYF